MKKPKFYTYWCATLEGERWLDSKYKLENTNEKQMEWVRRSVGDSVFLIVEMNWKRWSGTVNEFLCDLFSMLNKTLSDEEMGFLYDNLEECTKRANLGIGGRN